MTDTTNGWPGKPGVPLNPDKDGWHWLEDSVDGVGTGHIEAVYYFAWSVPIWYRAGNRSPITKPKQWRYLGPCLTPDGTAALQARVATVEDALADALISLHSAKLFILKKYGSINSAREASLECELMVLSESANKEIAQAANEALVNRAALEKKQ